ncbi:MAG: hypothetical protein ABF679_12335, partial [Lentilactobacillus diolivorans]|uniref:hypothetical protein n=1 Tax=Lentilactobacillus diolivorans TaxID=179838 RepID=UPI0039E90F67
NLHFFLPKTYIFKLPLTDNSVLRQEVAFCLTFLHGNSRDYKNGAGQNHFCPAPFVLVIFGVAFS